MSKVKKDNESSLMEGITLRLHKHYEEVMGEIRKGNDRIHDRVNNLHDATHSRLTGIEDTVALVAKKAVSLGNNLTLRFAAMIIVSDAVMFWLLKG